MGTARSVVCPLALEDVLRSFVAEEATSLMRHDVRGKLASVRNGAFYIRRKLEGFPTVLESDARLPKFLQMIDDELGLLGDMLVSRLGQPEDVGSSQVDVIAAASALFELLRLPASVAVTLPEAQTAMIKANETELQLAIFCLVENSVEAMAASSDRTVRVQVANGPNALAIEVIDSGPGIAPSDVPLLLKPFFSTKPERMGVGLKIARRIARRWGGELQISHPTQGGSVGLVFKRM